jgi:mono/diheme cytochrome c family protein
MQRGIRSIWILGLGLVAAYTGRSVGADDLAAKQDPPARLITFEADVSPIFRANCWRCHGEKSLKGELDLRSLAGVMKGGESGPVIVPGKPDESLLFEKVHDGEMPPAKKERLADAEMKTIRLWIENGAKAGVPDPAASSLVTQHDVIPVLLRHCTVCHGVRRREGDLDLRTKSSMLRGGKSGPAIDLVHPAESRLLERIRAGEMPPHKRLVEASVKPVETAEADLLARWIAAGAPEAAIAPDVATTAPDPLVTDKDRESWAFRPPQAVTVPIVHDQARVRNPIDAFLLRKLEGSGLAFSPEADRLTLLRRAHFDLTGLPPEPREVRDFLADPAPNAYEAMIDRLLASPRYGERWARYWLDVAGYADSEGKREQDLPRPYAWRYRDYVIRAFNNDKPYDRFLVEQIAGDELADAENAPEITQEIYDNLVATGFLRMVPDGTWANITGYVPDRIEVIADEIDVLGSAVMGLTMKCARCHSHKYDPIPHRDYYRLVDVFKGALDEYDWLKPDIKPGIGPVSQDVLGGRHLQLVTSVERRAWEATNAKVASDVELLRSALGRRAEVLIKQCVDERLAQLPEVLRDDLKTMLATPPDKRDSVQTYLAKKFEASLRIDIEMLKKQKPELQKEYVEVEAKVRALEARKSPEPRIQAVWDRGEPSPTYIYRRGDSQSPGRLVGPGVPSVLTDGKTPFEVKPPWPAARKTGRRLAFARWLTQPDHPLTARVAVNRIWKHHFGKGIVTSLGNFGKAGAPPTHPELLDWLSREFIKEGWSVKAIHRLIMTSSAYRQSSAVSPDQEARDPNNALYSRMPLMRLDAESLYDTLLLAAGRLNETPSGPADPVDGRADGLVTPRGSEKGWRRMIYVQQTRKQLPTHLENFDFPAMNPNCVERRDSTVAPQALHMMNNGMIHGLADQFAQRVIREVGTDPAKQIELVALVAMGRPPSDEERRLGVDSLARLTEQWSRNEASRKDAPRRALGTYCHAIMNSAGFLYVD